MSRHPFRRVARNGLASLRVARTSVFRNPESVECGRSDLVLVGATWTEHRCTRLRHWRGRHLLEVAPAKRESDR